MVDGWVVDYQCVGFQVDTVLEMGNIIQTEKDNYTEVDSNLLVVLVLIHVDDLIQREVQT